MLELRMVIFLIATTAMTLAVTPDKYSCCAPDKYIRRLGNIYTCYDIKNKTSTPFVINLKCSVANITIFQSTPELSFSVNENGQLIFKIGQIFKEFEPNTYCLTKMRNRTSGNDKNLAVLCNEEEEIKNIDGDVVGYCMVVSSICLLIAAAIYVALPELRDVQGKSLINFSLSLGLGLGILAAMKLVAYSDMNLCAARGFFAYFFIISSFFWSNAISIQILLSIRRPTVSNYEWKEFLWYALYAWGCPAILTVVMAIINFMPGDHVRPGIGLNHCWFFQIKQQWEYLYSVMTILITANIIIFMYTSIYLWQHSFSSNHLKALRYKFSMTVRLFIVMGISWIFEMIGSVSPTHIVWELLDIVNSQQGVLIFLVIVVFRRKVIKLMLKHGWLDCAAGPLERWLAVGEDEEDVVQHTAGLSMDGNIIVDEKIIR